MFDGQTVISDNVRDTLKNSIKNHKIPLKINTGEFCQNQNASLKEMPVISNGPSITLKIRRDDDQLSMLDRAQLAII